MDLLLQELVLRLELATGLEVVRHETVDSMVPRGELYLAAAKGKPVLYRVDYLRHGNGRYAVGSLRYLMDLEALTAELEAWE